MGDTPKEKREGDEAEEETEESTWEEDQKKREYYYDDAHGYTRYIPEEDVEETETNEEK